MLVMTLSSGDILDLGGQAKIKVSVDPQGRNRVRLSIDGDIAPIKLIKKPGHDEQSRALVGRVASVYKPEE